MVDFSLFTFCLTTQQVLGYETFYSTAGPCTCGFDMATSEMGSLQNFLSFE